jgi:hypothetical protein
MRLLPPSPNDPLLQSESPITANAETEIKLETTDFVNPPTTEKKKDHRKSPPPIPTSFSSTGYSTTPRLPNDGRMSMQPQQSLAQGADPTTMTSTGSQALNVNLASQSRLPESDDEEDTQSSRSRSRQSDNDGEETESLLDITSAADQRNDQYDGTAMDEHRPTTQSTFFVPVEHDADPDAQSEPDKPKGLAKVKNFLFGLKNTTSPPAQKQHTLV